MSKPTKIIIAVVFVLILAVVAFFFLKSNKNEENKNSDNVNADKKITDFFASINNVKMTPQQAIELAKSFNK
jgi:uncharacterized protein YpmB